MTTKIFFVLMASLLMGSGHLSQTRWGGLYSLSGWQEVTGLALTFIGMALLYSVLSSTKKISQSLWLTALSGFVYYLIALHWIGESLTVDHSAYTWLSVWGSIGITAIFFPWWMGAVLLFKLINIYRRKRTDSNALNPLLFATCWSLADLALSDFFYGIPLGVLGTSITGTVFEPIYSVIGLHGCTFLLVWIAAETARLVSEHRFTPQALGSAAVTAACLVVPYADDHQITPATVKLAAVQTNARPPIGPSGEDFNKKSIATNIHAIRTAFDKGVDLVVLPESAFLDDLAAEPELTAEIAQIIPEGRYLLTGSRQYEIHGEIDTGLDVQTFNVVHLLDRSGIIWSYRKSHLVLFGEYMPWIFRILGYDVLGGPPGGLAEGTGLVPVQIGDLPPALITICFEGLLSGPVQRAVGDSQWMLNLSNEALFGTTAGPELVNQYHRIRSMELGMPVVRSVATSFTGIVGETGEQLSMAKAETFAVLVEEVSMSSRNTVFRTLGYLPLYLFLSAVVTFAFVGRKRQSRRIF